VPDPQAAGGDAEMTENVTRLVLRIGDEHDDREELSGLTAALRQELLDLDVQAADQPSGGPAPLSSRAFEVAALGTLVITIAKSELLAAIVGAVTVWLKNRQQRTVKIEVDGDVLELTGLPTKERQQLTEEWLHRHATAQRPAAGTRSALIVASREYQDPGLRRLRAPVHDAEALARVLGDPRIGGFEVRTLVDAASYEICEAVEDFFADRSPDDLLLMHFSGHGVKDESGELHFATANTKLRRLGATAVAADFVNRRMTRSRSRRVVLLLDCCYAGAFERGMTARAGTSVNIEEQFGGRGRAVITASSSMEYAFEGDQLADANELAPSVFTSALVEGLETGEADRDQDGQVALDELYDYVYDRVRQSTPNQTPGKWAFGVQGDIYVARRARPVTKPAPLPSELQQAVDHPIAGIRAGAVQELSRLLTSRHAGMALAARLALEHLGRDDSRTVSAAALEALQAGPEPPPPASPPRPPAQRKREPAEPVARQAPPLVVPSPVMPASPAAESAKGAVPAAPAAPPTAATAVGLAEGRRLGPAAVAMVLGAACLVGSLFPTYDKDTSSTLWSYPNVRWYAILFAILAVASAVPTRIPRSGVQVPAGLLIGVVAASTFGLTSTTVYMLSRYSLSYFRIGEWLHLAGHVALAVAALLAARALAREEKVKAAFRRRLGLLPYLMIVLGAVNTAALFILWLHANRYDNSEADRFPFLWTAGVAVAISIYAATVSPRRFGLALLIGWVSGCAALYVTFRQAPANLEYVPTSWINLFGVSVLALVVTLAGDHMISAGSLPPAAPRATADDAVSR
jgi:Caspase domain